AAAPLLRLALVRLRDDAYSCVWTFHHLLLDGWSASLLLAEVLGRYRALRAGAPLDLPAAAPYRGFVAWLRRQDPAAAERYWRDALRGLTAPTVLPVGTPAGAAGAEGAEVPGGAAEPAEHSHALPERTVAALQALGR